MVATYLPAGTPTPTGYLQIACTSWFLYDWVLTLEDEINLVWLRKWTLTKGLYILIRLTTLILLVAETVQYVVLENLPESRCNIFSWVMACATAVVVVEVDIVLQLRVYIMYRKSRFILWLNAALCVANVGCAAAILVIFFSKTHFVGVPAYIQGACYDMRPKVLGAVWVAPLAYELYLAALAVYRLVQDHSAYGGVLDGPSLITILARDSVVYFFLIAGVAAMNIVLWALTPVTPGDSAVNLIHAAGGIGGARIILSMRDAALRPPSLPTSIDLQTQVQLRLMKR